MYHEHSVYKLHCDADRTYNKNLLGCYHYCLNPTKYADFSNGSTLLKLPSDMQRIPSNSNDARYTNTVQLYVTTMKLHAIVTNSIPNDIDYLSSNSINPLNSS